MTTKQQTIGSASSKAPDKQPVAAKTNDRSGNDVLDENTTFDVIISPTGYVTELSDTVDSMDGVTTEVIDIVNEVDGTNIELTIIEEPTEKPGVDQVDRFVEIRGIGPKVAELLVQAGIRKFSQLAETPIERIREILFAGGSHYRIYEPATWPQQAKQLATHQASTRKSPAAGKA